MPQTGFVWILIACAIYGVIHSILASNGFKGLASRRVGQAAYQRFYRLFFVIIGSITALPLFGMLALLPDQRIYTIPAPWVYLTLLIQTAAVVGLLASVLQTGAMAFLGLSQLTGINATHSAPVPEELVVTGLYRWVRHPLYTASFLVLWLTPVMTWNLLALNIGLSAYMLIGTIFEEHKLVQQFGKGYEEYRKHTPRIVPGIKIPD
jgi:methanethiol S-methyltransferase